MRDDQHRFLSLFRKPPARLTVEQTAWILNCQPHDVPVLIAARLLKPLGKPQPNSVKYFATTEILTAVEDTAWLSKLTVALSVHWQKKNRRAGAPVEFQTDGAAGSSPPRSAVG
ncbi:hypothetical protein [Oleiharenicola lentus]|uniref:hypothetical protein n=1 Tax=Oleiharenicola lentus TaxID=2508720 RepID=UPI003F6651BA